MATPVQYHRGAFPPKTFVWEDLIPVIGPASEAVARYDGTLAAIPNPGVLLSPLTTQEAVLSSRIEGTVATMGEVLTYEAEASDEHLPPGRQDDIFEVLNYRAAMRHAENLMPELPLCLRVIKQAHETLLTGVRGKNKAPGEIRRIQNWIGPPGCPVEEARFVPIEAHLLPTALSIWERFIHKDQPDRLVQLAVVHAEFEALHPFLDGNGRIGRMLVPLFLWQIGMIRGPMFYISAFLEANRDEYYERLLAVSRNSDWTGWCRFFLEAIKLQADENQKKAGEILDLYEELKPRFVDVTHSQFSILALDWIFEHPIFRTRELVYGTEIPDQTARRIVSVLKKQGILQVFRPSRGRKPAILGLPSLLNVAEGMPVF